jgi:hypothetical protein
MADDAPGFSAEQEQVIAALIDAVVPPSADGRLPGAGELDLVPHVERSVRQNPMLRPVLDYGLSAIAELAAKRSPAGLRALSRADWAAVFGEFTAGDEFFTPAFMFLVYGGYYQHPRVVTVLGLEPRAPHPKGYEMGPDDWSLLDPVRRRPRFRSSAE